MYLQFTATEEFTRKKKKKKVPCWCRLRESVQVSCAGTEMFPHFWSASKFPVAEEIYLRRKLTQPWGRKLQFVERARLPSKLLTCRLLATIALNKRGCTEKATSRRQSKIKQCVIIGRAPQLPHFQLYVEITSRAISFATRMMARKNMNSIEDCTFLKEIIFMVGVATCNFFFFFFNVRLYQVRRALLI